MNQFAKIFNVGNDGHQVLITLDHNEIDDTHEVAARCDMDGASIKQTLGGYPTYADALEAFDKVEQEYADIVFHTVVKYLSE